MLKKVKRRSLNHTKASAFVRQGGLRVTINAELSRNCDVSEADLVEALRLRSTVSPRLRSAIIKALLNEDGEFRLQVVRTQRGRPEYRDAGISIARNTALFVSERLSNGVILKAAISDACDAFEISRATVYSRLALWKKVQGATLQNQALPLINMPLDLPADMDARALKAKHNSPPKPSRMPPRIRSTWLTPLSVERDSERQARSKKLKKKLD